MAAFFFFVAAFVAIRFVIGGFMWLLAGRTGYKPGTYPLLAVIGLVALALGVVVSLVT